MTVSLRVTRRTFLQVSFTVGGSLLIGSFFGSHVAAHTSTPTASPVATAAVTPTLLPSVAPFQPNLFVQIDRDGTVTLTVHRSEMGQGVRTALAMILAEELDADWASVRVVQSPANPQIGNNQRTGGSGSVADTYGPLRAAGSRARAILVTAASQSWSVKPQDCTTEAGFVINPATNQKLAYADLVTLANSVTEVASLPLKQPSEFRLIGTAVPRLDEPAIVAGKAIYGLDVRLPNMLFAVIARSPVPGGTLNKYDATQAMLVPGVRSVVEVPSGVAVLAETTWAAMQGRAALDLAWTPGTNAVFSSATMHQQLVDAMQKATTEEDKKSFTTIEATYETPYLAHAAMEPLCCVVDLQPDHCDVWAPTQNPQDVQTYVRDIVGVPTSVNVTLMGGGFGRRLEVDFCVEAANVAKAAGVPIQLVWTREDDIQHDYYRQPTYHWLRAGWGTDGALALWRHYIAGPGLNGVVYQVGSEVLEEGLRVPYQIEDIHSDTVLADIPLPTGPWRAVMAATNAFANECFIDEVAAALKKDPYEFRMELLPASSPEATVLQLAARAANWSAPPPTGHARGIACHTYHDTTVAMVAEVSVTAGKLTVHKIVCAIDCGTVINPDMVAQQMEGGVAFALTALLHGEITFKQGQVEQSNFNNYPLLRMDEMPEVEVRIVKSIRDPQGTGEMGVPPLTPAVLNAVFALTGKRIRHTPLRAEDL